MGLFKPSTPTGQLLVLPTYKLDSNLVLLPGIIYNVTFSRFKAATLLSRFRGQTSEFALVKNLLNEYEFGENDYSHDSEGSDTSTNPARISQDALDGILRFVETESNLKKPSSTFDESSSSVSSEFDTLILAVGPNLDKIREPVLLEQIDDEDIKNNIVTVVRIVGITDDSTSVRLTLQALTRGSRIQGYRSDGPNEALIEVDWDFVVNGIKEKYQTLSKNVSLLFSSIDNFVISYRLALNTATNLAKKAKTGASGAGGSKDTGDLLTLNPLANALYMQLAGSKDFSKAYSSLQGIYAGYDSDIGAVDTKSFLRLLDLTCAIMPFPNHMKLTLLLKQVPADRIEVLSGMIRSLNSVFETVKENGAFVNHWFYKEATNTQKANVVANQLKSIRLVLEGMANTKGGVKPPLTAAQTPSRQLIRRPNGPPSQQSQQSKGANDYTDDDNDDDDDDDLRLIKDFVKNQLPGIVSITNDAKRLIIKDFKRIKSSPPGNSDFYVIRNYLEIVADLPWDKYVTKFQSNKDIDVVAAKKQLDDDHYGLEHVKQRLIQYLVVLKLLGMNADHEYETKKRQEEMRRADKSSSSSSLELDNKKAVNRDGLINESIVIANNDETSLAHASAREKNQKTKAEIKQEEITKAIVKQQAVASMLSRKNSKAPIILLAGPPGTGKTSLAKSIAKSLGRKFQRIALGGVRDEAEIRGHRRTYVGAMPGVIVQSLRKARCMNPVILLDEIDKVSGGADGANKVHGDPAAALLEVLDPEQNSSFIDHYLGFAVDLSQVIFVCTANEPYNLSRPLLDRLEMIEVGAYDYNEKIIIGKKYLLPRQVKRNGFPHDNLVKINDDVMEKIIIDYTREAGVRNFERKLGTICRHKAVEYSQSLSDNSIDYSVEVEIQSLPKYLGIPYSPFSKDLQEPFQSAKYGVVNGLSYNTDGSGSVLIFESIGFASDKSSLNMTGRLGNVLMESAKIGLTFVKLVLHRNLLNLSDHFADSQGPVDKLSNLEIHLHVPLGAILKDGPSAGITMALLFLSLIIEKQVPSDIAMTGEITLRGSVLPIGGVKEKLLGAHLSGMKKVILPRENRKDIIKEYCFGINDDSDLNDLLIDNDNRVGYKRREPEDYIYKKLGLKLYFASEFWDVIKVVWGNELLEKVDQARIVEYHL